jgi:2-oxoglutarate dehydrogenase E2 component (dihydrolipoamide succinyltransferase)
VGDNIDRDELLADIETDKVVLEVPSPESGVLKEILKSEGDIVLSSEIIARLDQQVDSVEPKIEVVANNKLDTDFQEKELIINPAARKLAAEKEIDVSLVTGTGRDGRITKEDVVKFSLSINKSVEQVEISQSAKESPLQGERQDRRVPMTRMRARIAERLLAVKQETAMLTTFNEVDMSALMDLRKEFQEEFTKAHNGTKLGFMGLFVKASVEALKRFPIVNASIDGTDIVYHGYQDIGVAVSTERGLVVPILRNAENLSIAEIEMNISSLAMKARDSKLSIEEMSGGTFTITNGGIYGSLLSTPILNPPQSAILGMHAIQERPISVAGEICVRPMMNLALSYDHRLVDGKDAVKFLVCIKQLIENPSKILLEI